MAKNFLNEMLNFFTALHLVKSNVTYREAKVEFDAAFQKAVSVIRPYIQFKWYREFDLEISRYYANNLEADFQ